MEEQASDILRFLSLDTNETAHLSLEPSRFAPSRASAGFQVFPSLLPPMIIECPYEIDRPIYLRFIRHIYTSYISSRSSRWASPSRSLLARR